MATISGIVVSERSGEPLAGALVWMGPPPEVTSMLHWSADADASGRFQFRDVPAGTYVVHAQLSVGRLPGVCFTGKEEIVVGNEKSIDFQVKVNVRGSLQGHVTSFDGIPIRGANLRIDEEVKGQFMAPSDRTGYYSFSFIEPGEYHLTCEAAGFERSTQSVAVGDAVTHGITELDFRLSPIPSELLPETGNVRGFALNEMGNPVLGAEVFLIRNGFEKKFTTRANYFDLRIGNFYFLDVPEDDYRILIRKPGFVTIETWAHVNRGRDNWVEDIRVPAIPASKPPEIEMLSISPVSFESGGKLTIAVRIAEPIGRHANLSANILGSGGFNMTFGIDKSDTPREFKRVFPKWEAIGLFKLFNLTVWDTDTAQKYDFPVSAQFEVLAKTTPPLHPESPIFTIPR